MKNKQTMKRIRNQSGYFLLILCILPSFCRQMFVNGKNTDEKLLFKNEKKKKSYKIVSRIFLVTRNIGFFLFFCVIFFCAFEKLLDFLLFFYVINSCPFSFIFSSQPSRLILFFSTFFLYISKVVLYYIVLFIPMSIIDFFRFSEKLWNCSSASRKFFMLSHNKKLIKNIQLNCV